jgi:hypothetical protein
LASKTNPIPLNVQGASGTLLDYLTSLSRAVYQLWARVNSPSTVTPSGTTGAQTINQRSGSVNFAAGSSSLTVTNSLVTAESVVIATVGANDTTMKSVAVATTDGSFTLHANAAPTSETRVNWLVL